MPTPVYAAVAAESRGRSRYRDDLHQRVDGLVQEWLNTPRGGNIPFAAGDREFAAEASECDEWVKQEYRYRYGQQDAQAVGPFGCPVFILMAILGGIISWLVGRTLDKMFPRGGNTPNVVGSSG